MTDRLLTCRELAEHLGVDIRTIQRRIARGHLGIPVIDISTSASPKTRFRQSDVDAYLKSREIA